MSTDYGDICLSNAFLESARDHFLLSDHKHETDDSDQDELLPITCPVRFLHGLADTEADAEVSLLMGERIEGEDVLLLMSKTADHSFSRPENIQMLFEEIDYLVHPSEDAKKLSLVDWRKMAKYSESGILRKVKDAV